MSLNFILLHGYSGSPADLLPLEKVLSDRFPESSIKSIKLPGHDGLHEVPPFDETRYLRALADELGSLAGEKTKRIYIGHSTGGTLLLRYIKDSGILPDLLILIGVPAKIDTAFLDRWSRHSGSGKEISFSSTARLVSFINRPGISSFETPFPVLILHGEEDALVPPEQAFILKERLGKLSRVIIIPSGKHHLMTSSDDAFTAEAVLRAAEDVLKTPDACDLEAVGRLAGVEPEAERFLKISRFSCRHLARSPSMQRLTGREPELVPHTAEEPVFANIEITTRCNLECAYCMRSRLPQQGLDMPKKTFARILDLLPHAYRITLVGLGEPLLHHNPAGLVAEAVSRGRRVGLVTNGMCLDRETGQALLDAGLHSIAFSLDAPNQEVADIVRRGSDLKRIIENISCFTAAAKKKGTTATAVFSAVSVKTVPYLEELVDLAAKLGVHVLMLTDLNFQHNVKETLWKNIGSGVTAVARDAALRAFSKKLPVLSVRALEEFGLWKRYEQFLLIPPHQLYRRAARRTWCVSPWQTVPVNVQGDVSVCDCQPEKIAGNIFSMPFTEIWNGEIMAAHRERMLSIKPPSACGICPRF